jgi:hypothetical protein
MVGLGILALALWVVGIALVLGTLAVSIVARRIHQPLLAIVALLPIGAGILMIAFGLSVPSPSRALNVVLALAVAGLGVFAGAPLTTVVLARAARGQRDGDFGGIMVAAAGDADSREVLRGGAAIGYLERVAIVAGVALGHPEVIAGIIAIKGLGRFSELDSAEARERFIIGTLTSMIWATACGAIIVIPGGVLG